MSDFFFDTLGPLTFEYFRHTIVVDVSTEESLVLTALGLGHDI